MCDWSLREGERKSPRFKILKQNTHTHTQKTSDYWKPAIKRKILKVARGKENVCME